MPDEKKERSGGLSLQTLLISAGAAVAAATIVPLFWEQGTLFATAMTPVVVALVSEALRKPVERVSAVAPRVARRPATGAAVRRYEPESTRARDAAGVGARGRGHERFDPLPPARRADAPVLREDDPYGLRGAGRRRPRVRIAILTGLLAFMAAVAVVTASELALFGGSVSGERGRTTIFGGQKKAGDDGERRPDREAAPAADPNEQATPEPTPSPAPEEEATAEPTPSPTPTVPEATPTPTPTP
jgi:hypothetical protein